MKNFVTLAALLTGAAALVACSERSQDPTALSLDGPGVQASAVKFWDAGASAAWNQLATSLAARRPIDAGRLYAYLSLAQFRAAAAAEGIQPHPPTSAAIGAASAALLNSFFPLDVAEIEAALDAQEAAKAWPGAMHEDFARGEALGRAVGAKVLVFAAGDRFGLADPGTPPIGPGTGAGVAVPSHGAAIAPVRSSWRQTASSVRSRRRPSGRLSTSPHWPKCARSPTRARRNSSPSPCTGT